MIKFICISIVSIVLSDIFVSLRSDPESCSSELNSCPESESKDQNEFVVKSDAKFKRFLIYDQNFGEGFNLRRDVYIRMALMANKLADDWTLVLPKWSLIPHWKSGRHSSDADITDWKSYFDVKSLNQFISVKEFNDFMAEYHTYGKEEETPIDIVLSLEHFADTFHSNDWSERYSIEDCNQTKHFEIIDGKVLNLFDNNKHLHYKRLVCLKIEGFISTLREIIEKNFSDLNTVFISNTEIVVNNEFGSKDYWSVRRSMRFNSHLISVANDFRKQFLNSDDFNDKTVVDSDWQTMVRTHGQAVGGPYLSVHLRRSDFAKWRTKDVPDIECAVKQIQFVLNSFVGTDSVFIASDANPEEWLLIEQQLNDKNIRMFRFKSDQLTDGQKAIVEQWIAVHGMVFLGTYDSTFSFRIQEEREILGFSPNKTFNSLCPKCYQTLDLCKQESQWKIVY